MSFKVDQETEYRIQYTEEKLLNSDSWLLYTDSCILYFYPRVFVAIIAGR
jgi:hypothetical protein